MIKKLFFLALFSFFALSPVLAVAAPQPALAQGAAVDKACERRILTFPTWFRGLGAINPRTGGCDGIRSPNEVGGIGPFVWRIVLNVIEIGLQLVGYISVFFIIYGGFQYLTGGSIPAQTQKALQTILNALIGLAISIASVGLVNLVFGLIT